MFIIPLFMAIVRGYQLMMLQLLPHKSLSQKLLHNIEFDFSIAFCLNTRAAVRCP